MQWSNTAPAPVFKQESFKVEPQEPQISEHYPQHNNENFHPQQQPQQQQQASQQHGNEAEFQHLFSPLKYLNDLDCEQQYQGLGVAPLPLHGQVRPIKVEQQEASEANQWTQHQPHDENHPSNLSSTPPILRRRGRKRDVEDDKIDQFLRSPNMSFDMTGS